MLRAHPVAGWHAERLPELVGALAGRPRYEALRGHVTELLQSGFGAPYEEIGHEVYLLDGRLSDALALTRRNGRLKMYGQTNIIAS